MKLHILRLKKGDSAVPEIVSYCKKNKIMSAWFSGIGAAQSVKLAIYDLKKKEYIRKDVSGVLEILNYLGNVSQLGGQLIVHSHVTLSDKSFGVLGGHVDELVIAATCEIILHELDINLSRKYDEQIGLNLLEI